MANLATVIDEARRRAFVGRDAELSRLVDVLSGADPRRLMFVHGPGGVGKTALLDRMRLIARAHGRDTIAIDGREIDVSSDGLRVAFDRAFAEHGGDRSFVVLDGYERFGQLDGWVRGELLPSLPAATVVVISGRDPPPPAWRTDPAWRALVAVHPLGALSPAESRELLRRAGVSEDAVERLATLGRGHPLTLALLADAVSTGATVPDDLAEAPDLVAALVSQVVGDVPSDAHATGLAVCAHAWLTTEDLLRRAVGDECQAVWAWLESRPYVTRAPDGLYPHDLVRDALEADLLRRSRDGYRRVHRIVHEHVMSSLRRADGFDRVLWAHQKMWLHRRSPLSIMYLTIRDQGPVAIVDGRADDHAAVVDMIRTNESPESAALAQHWLDAAPEGLQVIRSGREVLAFCYWVVSPTDPSLCDADPVVGEILDHAARTCPARPGEQVWIGRFLGGRAGYHHDPYAVAIAAMSASIDWVTRPLAWSFVPSVDPTFWGPGFSYIAFRPELEIHLGELRYVVYANDWRRLTVDNWLDVLNERELTGATGPAPPDVLRPAPLDRAGFDRSVRRALRDLQQPDRLHASPLMGSALAFGYDGADVGRLRATFRRAIDQLGREPRGEALHRVLDRTFLHGAPSQEAAAEVLNLPNSTYRRHLSRAVERLTDLLWAVEIGQVRLDPPRSAARDQVVSAE